MATQYSLSDDPKKLGTDKIQDAQSGNVKVSAAAGFIVAITVISYHPLAESANPRSL